MTTCDCRYSPNLGIAFCPLHSAAEEMLAAIMFNLDFPIYVHRDIKARESAYAAWSEESIARQHAAVNRAQGGD